MGNGSFKNDMQGKKIKGVTCDVRNCYHNDEEGCCTAGKINVGPGFAKCCTDTVCATFRERD